MKFKSLLTLAVAALLSAGAMAQSTSPSTKWHWNKGQIVVDTPERPAGQKDVIGMTAPKLEKVRVAFVGLGMRGPGAVNRFTFIPGVEIVALCDYEPSRAEGCQNILRKQGLAPADLYTGAEGYKELCKRPDIDLVYVATDWDHHFPVAKCALENGKHAVIEVPSAMNLEQCWELINLSEKTRKHCMILENCCYDMFELRSLEMAQHGVFGEVLRAQGAYIHNLDEFWPYYWQNPDGSDPDKLGWRMKYNMENRGDVYATHGLGPVAQVLNIHRGDRIKTLVAMDTKSVYGKEYVEKKTGKPCENYRNGDHTTTLLLTEQHKNIEIQHDVMNPQPYNRLYQLTGTKGFANKYPIEGYAVDAAQLKATGNQPAVDNLSAHSFMPESEKQALEKQYESPIIKRYMTEEAKTMGHGGMDFLMDSRLVYCLHNGLPLDMDVYDLAEWCCLAELGTLSMDNNNASVAFPDFTRGHWNDVKGYSHAWAPADEDAATEARSKQITQAQKDATAQCKLWELYDACKKADAKAKPAAQKKYAAARAKAKKQIAKALAAKK